ncbi:MAG: hypothetical protein KDA69_18180 [Planctomycetaceae bacterium]|nr:hypothetical protein [Planctomycetaceae bacterium]
MATSHPPAPDEVDNMLPGLAVAFGWLPYVVFFGPMFLVMKSMDRVRSQPVENISREPENSEY